MTKLNYDYLFTAGYKWNVCSIANYNLGFNCFTVDLNIHQKSIVIPVVSSIYIYIISENVVPVIVLVHVITSTAANIQLI